MGQLLLLQAICKLREAELNQLYSGHVLNVCFTTIRATDFLMKAKILEHKMAASEKRTSVDLEQIQFKRDRD